MCNAETERFPPPCALGAVLTHPGPAPVGRMNQTVLVEGMNDRRSFIKAIEFAEGTDLPLKHSLTAEGQLLLLHHFKNDCLGATY